MDMSHADNTSGVDRYMGSLLIDPKTVLYDKISVIPNAIDDFMSISEKTKTK